MANVTCTRCQASYQAAVGQSTCPECQWVNVRSGILDGFSPAVKFLLVTGLVIALLIAVGFGISVYDATN